MYLADLHCDTLYEALRQKKSLISNDLSISFDRLREYERFIQIMAVWSDPRPDEDRIYDRFFEAAELLSTELSKVDEIALCTSFSELETAEKSKKGAIFLAVEGGRLLSDKLDRLDELRNAGVRFLTLVWDGVCRLGGAFDTDEGLTELGREAVKRCFELGVIPDVSHSSQKMCAEVIELAGESGKVCVATHSNSKSVCDHRRNLTDEHFKSIMQLGGIVGISLAPIHLTSSEPENCTIDDVILHIEHYLALGGSDTVCLGCDLDGVSRLPKGIKTVSDIPRLAERLAQLGYSDDLIGKLFYANARNFIFHWIN